MENDVAPHSFGEWLQVYQDPLIFQWIIVWNGAEACYLLVLICIHSLLPASPSLG